MDGHSSENFVKAKVEDFVESVDANKNKKMDGNERNFAEDAKKQLVELRTIAEGPDVVKREALTRAIIEVTDEYEGLSPNDVYQWMNAIMITGGMDVPGASKHIDDQTTDTPDPIRSDIKVGTVTVQTRQDILPTGSLEALNANIGLQEISSEKNVNYDQMSYKQKTYVLLGLGQAGAAGYDESRAKNDRYSSKVVLLKDFLQKMKARDDFESIMAEARHISGWNGVGSYSIPKDSPYSPKMLDKLSKSLGIPVADLKNIWDNSKDDYDFSTQIYDAYLSAGVCRDIAVFQAKYAHDMGLTDSFVTTGIWGDAGHLLGGFRNEKGNIVFFNYGQLVETDTPNMKMALATMERYLGDIELNYLQGKGKDEGHNLIQVKSEASDTVMEIAKGTSKQQSDILTDNLNRGGLEPRMKGVTYSIEKNKTGVDIKVDNLGGSMIISSRLFQPQRAANSIDEAASLRVAQEYNAKYLVGGLGTSIAHLQLRADRMSDRQQLDKLLVDLYLKTHKKIRITKQVEYQISAMVDAIIGYSLDDMDEVNSISVELSTGQRLAYVNPGLTLYVGMQTLHSGVPVTIQAANVKLINDLLAANVGANARLGVFEGHEVRIAPQVQVGSTHSGLAMQYQGDLTLEAMGEKGSAYLKGRGKYTESDDFRIENEARKEVSAGYIKELGSKVLEIKGFAFQDTPLGKLKDPRLDNLGMGFQVTYTF